MPGDLRAAAGALLTTAVFCHEVNALAWRSVPPEDLEAALREGMEPGLSEGDRRRIDALTTSVDMALVSACAIALAEEVEAQAALLQMGGSRTSEAMAPGLPETEPTNCQPHWDSPGAWTTAWQDPLTGFVRIGGPEATCYFPGPTVLTLDAGGNDRYANGAGVGRFLSCGSPAQNNAISVSVDVGGGHDEYVGKQAGGAAGIGILFDDSGDDVYRASDPCEVAFQGGNFVRGIGLLFEREGDDDYRCDASFTCQGFAWGGLGLLRDLAGRDLYSATSGFAQGASFGVHSLGALLDDQGDDHYVTDWGGQGISGPQQWELGLLVDLSGNDHYEHLRQFPYGRGFGTGGSAVFIDAGGEDTYTRGAGTNNAKWGPGPATSSYSPGFGAPSLPAIIYGRGMDCPTLEACLGSFP